MFYAIPSLLVITAVGYLVLDGMNVTRFHYYRLSGYHIFFSAAIIGFLLFAMTAVGVQYVHVNVMRCLAPAMYKPIDPLVTHLILVFLAGVVVVFLSNRCWSRDEEELKAMEIEGNYIDVLANRAMEEVSPVQVLMSENSVYFGFIVRRQNFNLTMGDLVLLPIFNAYRDQHGLKLNPIGNYVERYERILDEGKSFAEFADGTVAIPKSEIAALEVLAYDQLADLVRSMD